MGSCHPCHTVPVSHAVRPQGAGSIMAPGLLCASAHPRLYACCLGAGATHRAWQLRQLHRCPRRVRARAGGRSEGTGASCGQHPGGGERRSGGSGGGRYSGCRAQDAAGGRARRCDLNTSSCGFLKVGAKLHFLRRMFCLPCGAGARQSAQGHAPGPPARPKAHTHVTRMHSPAANPSPYTHQPRHSPALRAAAAACQLP